MGRRGFLGWLLGLLTTFIGACMSHYPQRNADTILDGTFGPTGATAGTGPTAATGGTGPTGATGGGGGFNTASIFFGTSSSSSSVSSGDVQISWSSVVIDGDYTNNGDTITVGTAGLYFISVMVSLVNTNGTPGNQEISAVYLGEDQGVDPLDNLFQARDVGADGEEASVAIIEGIYDVDASADVGVLVGQSFGSGAMALNGQHSLLIEFLR